MTPVELNLLASAWIAYWRAPEDSRERESFYWATERERYLVRKSPDEAWDLILAVLLRDKSEEIQQVLSAGPLEDLLVYHGSAFIERVEHEAQANPQFAFLLGSVWKNAMSDDVWSRVRGVWDRRGWDGTQ